MNTKMCTICKIAKDINNFYKRYSECIDCNRTRGLKRYFENEDKMSNQQKYNMKKLEKKFYYRNKQKRYTN